MRLLVLLSVLTGAAPALAACKPDGLLLFPRPGAVVPTNARFFLEGVGKEQPRVEALVGQRLQLQSDDDQVTVVVQKGWKSSQGRVAVILRPQTPLQAEKLYTLALDRVLPGYELLNTEPGGTARWRTGKGADRVPPKWTKKPAPAGGEYAIEGEQLRRFIKLSLTLQEESPAYLVLSLRRARGPTSVQNYFVPVNGNEALVGHDACSGGFSYEDGRAYRARIEGYDAAGNVAAKLPVIEFQAPKQETP